MASSQEYVDFILEQCEGLTARAMMGEYVPYYGGKVVGGNQQLGYWLNTMPGFEGFCEDILRQQSGLTEQSR